MTTPKTKEELWSRIKNGEAFPDEVLAAFGIRKTVREVRAYTDDRLVEHAADTRSYPTDTTPVSRIISDLAMTESHMYAE